MRHAPRCARSLAHAIAIIVVLAGTAGAGEVVRVGDRPAAILEAPTLASTVIATAGPAIELEVIDRNGDWVSVLTPPDADGARRTGWIHRGVLAKPAKSPTRRPAGPPKPVGALRAEKRSVAGEWIVPRALRASLGFNYQSARVAQTAGSLDDRLLGGGASVVTSFAVLDPRILSVDFAGDFQASRATTEAYLASFRNTSGVQSYRLDVGILSGRRAPLRLWADRMSSTSDLRPFGATLDPLRRTRGVRAGTGFTWDIDPDPALPHVQIAASAVRQLDERNYLFGYSSTNEERRAELRADRDYRLGRYDLQFTHAAFVYDVPAAGVRSDTRSDVLLATARLTPSRRLTVDLHGRGSRFLFGAGSQASMVTGAGGDGAVRYDLPGHLAVSSRYSFSNNAFEAALSGRLDAGQPGATPVTNASQLTTRTVFQDGEGRVEYATRPLTAAAIVKGVSFDVPASQPATLTALRTAGGLVRAQHAWHVVGVTAGGDMAAGTARSNQGAAQRYREAGLDVGVSLDAARTMHFGVDGSARRVARLSFFPVTLDTVTGTLRFETLRPAWARLRASITRFDSRRDIMLSDARDRHTGYGLGLAGGWYDLSADINQADSRSLLLAPGVLGSRPEVAILIASRPEIFGNLLASSDLTRVFGLQLRPIDGLQIQARARRQEQRYPGLFGFRLSGGQAWASWQLRELQLEVGWDFFDSWTSFGTVRDRRVYVRIRRNLVFF